MIFTGIAAIASKGDLLSRGLTIELSPPEELISPEEFENRFEAIRPLIAGALYDLLAKVLTILPSVEGTYKGRERFGKFIDLGLAIEQALEWPKGTVERVVSAGRDAAHETAIDASPVGQAVRDLMLGRECWTGTATKLLEELAGVASEKTVRGQYWPSDATRLAKKLNELKPNFAACGIEITTAKSGGTKTTTIKRLAVTEASATAAGEGPTPLFKPGDAVAMNVDSYEGLHQHQHLTVTEIDKAKPTAPGLSGVFAKCRSASGGGHSIWVEHLRLSDEADQLGVWEVAA
jgi:hypothetical protein